jgi:hypothetical protein
MSVRNATGKISSNGRSEIFLGRGISELQVCIFLPRERSVWTFLVHCFVGGAYKSKRLCDRVQVGFIRGISDVLNAFKVHLCRMFC